MTLQIAILCIKYSRHMCSWHAVTTTGTVHAQLNSECCCFQISILHIREAALQTKAKSEGERTGVKTYSPRNRGGAASRRVNSLGVEMQRKPTQSTVRCQVLQGSKLKSWKSRECLFKPATSLFSPVVRCCTDITRLWVDYVSGTVTTNPPLMLIKS